MKRDFVRSHHIWPLALAAASAAGACVVALLGAGPVAIVALTLVALTALVVYERSMVARLSAENSALSQSVGMLEMAESLAGVGRWRYETASDTHQWSPELSSLIGIFPPRQPDKALVSQVLGPDGGGLVATLNRHSNDQETFEIEFEVQRPDGEHRLLRAKARNEMDQYGQPVRVFMVVRDVTEEYQLARRLKEEQESALAAARKAQALANTDPLTGLANRRHAMNEIDRAIMQARQNAQPLSLIVFDLDHFKAVNDTHGHLAGDQVLTKVAGVTQAMVGDGDIAARFGGEEFACLLRDTDAERASEFAESLRLAIERNSAVAGLSGVTASIGHATFSPGDTSLTLFAKADAALYEAKKAGRNRVCMAG